MKKLLLAVMLLPALAAAEEAKANAEPGIEAPKQTATTTTTATTTEGEKKDGEKKDEKPAATATTTQQPAQQQQVNASLMTPEQLAAAGAWTIGINLDNSVGSGTFANAAYYSSVMSSLSGSVSKPFKLFGRSFMGSGGVGVNYEFSTPDAVNARRVSWGDARVGVSMPGAIKEKFTGISFNPALSASVPLTMESWNAGTISNLGLNMRAIRQVGPVSLRYGIGGGYTINTSSYRVQRPTSDPILYGGPLCRLSDPPGSCGSAGMTSTWSFNTNLTALWFASDALVVYGQFGVSSRWNNAATNQVDEFTPKGVDMNGDPVANVGQGLNNGMSGALGASYNITDIFSVSGTISNDGPARTMDGKAFRFPFFDFISPENSLTSYTVSLSATL